MANYGLIVSLLVNDNNNVTWLEYKYLHIALIDKVIMISIFFVLYRSTRETQKDYKRENEFDWLSRTHVDPKN